MQHAAQRHRDNLDDYKRDFLRARVSSRKTLLTPEQRRSGNSTNQSPGLCQKGYRVSRSGYRTVTACARHGQTKDIDINSDYKTSQTDALLADRGRIDSSHRMIDDTLKCVNPLEPF